METILPAINKYSEDLYEKEYYLNKRWLEVRDGVNFHESILHIFQEKDDYMTTIDGNVSKGKWRILEHPNLLLLERGGGEVFEIAFLNSNFFILSKHGDQTRKKQRQYLVMGYEPIIRGLTWKEVAELLYQQHQSNKQAVLLSVVLIGLVIIAVLFYFIKYDNGLS